MYISLQNPQRWFRLPGKDISQADDNIDSSGPVIVRNHVHVVAVKLQYSLYRVE